MFSFGFLMGSSEKGFRRPLGLVVVMVCAVGFVGTQDAVGMRVVFAFDLDGAVSDVFVGQLVFDAVGDLFGFGNGHAAVYDDVAG